VNLTDVIDDRRNVALIEKVQKEDLMEILKLQYLAHQSEVYEV